MLLSDGNLVSLCFYESLKFIVVKSNLKLTHFSYKMALLVAENPDKAVLSSMVYPIPVFVGICELHPHYFEIQQNSAESTDKSSKRVFK